MKKNLLELLNEDNSYVELHKTKKSQRPLINLYREDIIQALKAGYSKTTIYNSMVEHNIISCTYSSFLRHTKDYVTSPSSSENTSAEVKQLAVKKPEDNHFAKGFKFNPIVDEKELFGD